MLGFAFIIPIGAWHRIKSQATGEKLDRRQEGLFILLALRPIAATGLIGMLLYLDNRSGKASIMQVGGCRTWEGDRGIILAARAETRLRGRTDGQFD